MSSFYIHLESNSSFDHFQDNTISAFRNWLSTPIILEPNSFEVALVECSYPSTPIHFSKGTLLYRVKEDSNSIEVPQSNGWHAVYAPIAIKTLDDLFRSLNSKNYNFNLKDGRVCIEPLSVDSQIIYIFEFASELSAVLGFTESVTLEVEPTQSEHQISFISNNSRYFIYCDIVENQYIGDTTAPILRSFVHTHTEQDKIISKSFNNLQYVSLAKPEFDSIKMYIRNEYDSPPPFTFGSFSASLHFRRKRL